MVPQHPEQELVPLVGHPCCRLRPGTVAVRLQPRKKSRLGAQAAPAQGCKLVSPRTVSTMGNSPRMEMARRALVAAPAVAEMRVQVEETVTIR